MRALGFDWGLKVFDIKLYLHPKEPTFVGFLIMIFLFISPQEDRLPGVKVAPKDSAAWGGGEVPNVTHSGHS